MAAEVNTDNLLDSALGSFKGLYDKYGKDKKIQITPKEINTDQERFNTPFLHQELLLGGGPPKGQIFTTAGLFSTGKTSMMMAMAGANPECKVAFLDGGFNWLPSSYLWAENFFGIRRDNIVIMQPDFIEEAGEMIYDATEYADIVIFDEFDLLAPQAEYEGSMSDQQMGQMARAYKKFFRKSTGQIYRNDSGLWITNHLYENIGNVFEPLKEPGGRAMGDYPSQKLWMSQSKDRDPSKEVVGQKINVEIKKDKVEGNFGKKFTLYYENGIGFNFAREVLDLGESLGVIQKGGSWYSYEGDKLGQGAKKSCQFLRDNENLQKEIREKIIFEYNKD